MENDRIACSRRRRRARGRRRTAAAACLVLAFPSLTNGGASAEEEGEHRLLRRAGEKAPLHAAEGEAVEGTASHPNLRHVTRPQHLSSDEEHGHSHGHLVLDGLASLAEEGRRRLQDDRDGKWYVDWYLARCVQSCPPTAQNPHCGGNARWDHTLFASADLCCKVALTWQSSESCTATGGPETVGMTTFSTGQSVPLSPSRNQGAPSQGQGGSQGQSSQGGSQGPQNQQTSSSQGTTGTGCPPPYSRQASYKSTDAVTINGYVYACKDGQASLYCNQFPPDWSSASAGGGSVHVAGNSLGWRLVGGCDTGSNSITPVSAAIGGGKGSSPGQGAGGAAGQGAGAGAPGGDIYWAVGKKPSPQSKPAASTATSSLAGTWQPGPGAAGHWTHGPQGSHWASGPQSSHIPDSWPPPLPGLNGSNGGATWSSNGWPVQPPPNWPSIEDWPPAVPGLQGGAWPAASPPGWVGPWPPALPLGAGGTAGLPEGYWNLPELPEGNWDVPGQPGLQDVSYDQPNMPGLPELPEVNWDQPEMPGQPGQPDQPGQPGQPGQPDQPPQPPQPGQPPQPPQPPQPDQPGLPAIQGSSPPELPPQPPQPDQPGLPAIQGSSPPELPPLPGQPELPGLPSSQGGVPPQPGQPDQPGLPPQPKPVSASKTPGTPGSSSGGGRPQAGSKPRPNRPNKPENAQGSSQGGSGGTRPRPQGGQQGSRPYRPFRPNNQDSTTGQGGSKPSRPNRPSRPNKQPGRPQNDEVMVVVSAPKPRPRPFAGGGSKGPRPGSVSVGAIGFKPTNDNAGKGKRPGQKPRPNRPRPNRPSGKGKGGFSAGDAVVGPPRPAWGDIAQVPWKPQPLNGDGWEECCYDDETWAECYERLAPSFTDNPDYDISDCKVTQSSALGNGGKGKRPGRKPRPNRPNRPNGGKGKGSGMKALNEDAGWKECCYVDETWAECYERLAPGFTNYPNGSINYNCKVAMSGALDSAVWNVDDESYAEYYARTQLGLRDGVDGSGSLIEMSDGGHCWRSGRLCDSDAEVFACCTRCGADGYCE